MSSRLVVTGALFVVLLTACGGEDAPPSASRPTGGAASSAAPTTSPSPTRTPTPSSTPSPTPTAPEPASTCNFSHEVSSSGSGFVIEWSIMSGNPNPAWRLTKAEGAKLRLLLAGHRDLLDLDGPDEPGGYGVTADGAATEFLERRDIPSRFWVQGDNEITEFIGGTLPC